MRLSVVMGQARKVFGVETPLTQPYSAIYYWGPPSPRIHARPLPAPSAPVMVSYSHLFQVLGRDKKLALRWDSVQLTQSPLQSGEVKTHTEWKTCMGPRLVLR